MDRNALLQLAADMTERSELNRVAAEVALLPELIGTRHYNQPLLGVAAADDPYFQTLQKPGVIGPIFRLPRDWLPSARSAVSLFFPFADGVVASNGRDPVEPSPAWFHARIEGQAFISAVCSELVNALRQAGHEALAPALHPEFISRKLDAPPEDPAPRHTSNWSERHVAHVAGLGTFGLSAGLITEKGIAGRFGSIVTSLALEPNTRNYSGPFDYCTRCGACIPCCVHEAITEAGKQHPPCDAFLTENLRRNYPYYGCGKCQVRVPCSRQIPPVPRKKTVA